MLKIASWNINSVRMRIDQLCQWLEDTKIGVVLLQETKCMNEYFPTSPLEDLGYNCVFHGQKSYNGVAILSLYPVEIITTEIIPGDDQARYIEVVTCKDGKALTIASVYVPNGKEINSKSFEYKMIFFDALAERAKQLINKDGITVIGGDYNVAPEPIDVYDSVKLDGRIGFHHEERRKFRKIISVGITDVFRMQFPTVQGFSWWDYRSGGWKNNHGMRIDNLLLSPQAVDLSRHSYIDSSLRAQEKPSDHAPIIVELDL